MFRRLPDPASEQVTFSLDGQALVARKGDSVATALLAAGISSCRETSISGVARAPYCLMGVCFECLVTIEGIGNCQACLVPVAQGMRVQRQRGAHRVAEEPGGS